jgi:hypothetical protein
MASAKSAYRREHTGTRVGDNIQRVAQDVARAAGAHPLNGATLIDAEPDAVAGSGLAFTAGVARSIAHGLRRKALGFFEVYGPDLPSALVVGLVPTAHPSGITSTTHITVTPMQSGTCFVVVF